MNLTFANSSYKTTFTNMYLCEHKSAWGYVATRLSSPRQQEHSSTWHFWLPQADSPKCLFYQEIMITIVTAPVRPYHLHFNLSNHGNLAPHDDLGLSAEGKGVKTASLVELTLGKMRKCLLFTATAVFVPGFTRETLLLFIYFATSEQKFLEA